MVSVIVPMYNEEERIGPFLTELLEFSEKNLKNYEIILVNDGSTDKTLHIVEGLIRNHKNVRIVSYQKNMGKGFAVKTGVDAAKYDPLLFIDADGSIAPNEIPNMLEKLKEYDIVVGSRAIKGSDVKYTFIRNTTGIIFNRIVNLLFPVGVYDTLCGFKGFKREVAKKLFNGLKSDRWVFDVELFYKARKNRFSLYQMPLVWRYKPGSKIGFLTPFKMFFDLVVLRLKLLK